MTSPIASPSTRERVAAWAIRAVGAVPLLLTIVAEAAWIAIFAALINEYALRQPVLDVAWLLVFVVAGLLVSQRFGLRLGPRWPGVALLLIIATAAAGVLVSPAARDALLAGGLTGPAAAFVANPGGLLAGMALLRGIAWGHAGVPLPEDRLIRLLGGGVVLVTFAAVAGALAIEPWRGAFLALALADGLVFGGCAMLALAFTRQAIAAGDVAAGWQRNPIWVVSLLVVVGTLVIVSSALSGQVRPTLELLGAVLAAPIIVIGLIAGWTKRGLRFFVGLLIGAVILGSLGSAISKTQLVQGGRPEGIGAQASPVDTAVAVGVAGGLLVVVVLIVLLLVRLWMRQLGAERDDVIEERYVDRTEMPEPSARRRRRLPFGRQPADAVSAYRALLADLAERHGVRREAWETPREHAERLRVDSNAGLPLNLLAADYALASFGNRQLSATENRRAVGRWRLLRRRLQAMPEPTDEELAKTL